MTNELAPRRIISVEDNGREIDMEVYLELDYEGKSYGIAFSKDLPILLVESLTDADGEYLEPVSHDVAMRLRRNLAEATKGYQLKPEFREDELFLVGDYPDDFVDDCEHIEVHVEDGVEEYARLFDLDDGQKTYLIITPLVPDLFPIEFVNESAARMLADDELNALEELFRQALIEAEDEED